MLKKTKTLSFDEVVTTLGNRRFDVAPASTVAKSAPGVANSSLAPAKSPNSRAGATNAMRVSKYGCAAEIAPDPDHGVRLLSHPGFVLGGEISTLLDRGYQKFLKTSRLEITATADHLRAIHQFAEELKEAAGITTLYNEALGTTSDSYMYDRVKGR